MSSPDAYQTAKGILEKRFGHPSVVAEDFRNKLENLPRVGPGDGTALREFADFLRTCELAMQSVEDLETLNKESDNKKLLKILPSWAHPKRRIKVCDYQEKYGDTKFPPFPIFVKYFTEIADIQCLPVLTGLDVKNKDDRERRNTSFKKSSTPRKSYKAGTLSTNVGETDARKKTTNQPCAWCKKQHDLDSCQEFLKKPLKDRILFLIRSGLCLRCLEHGHMVKENKCTARTRCTSCKNLHPTCLHKEREQEKPDEAEETFKLASEPASAKCTRVCGTKGQETGQDQSLIIPVWMSTSETHENEQLTYALIDCQSNATFITEKLRQDLGLDGVESNLLLSTMHEKDEVVECRKVKGLNVMDMKHQTSISLPQTFTRQTIPYKSSQIPKPEIAMCWEHLKPIASELMPYRSDLEVGLLIGTNCPKAIKPREVIPGSDDDPYAVRSDLGWSIIGRVSYPFPRFG